MLQGSGGVWQSGWISVEPQQGQTWGMFAHTPPGLKRLSKMLPSPCPAPARAAKLSPVELATGGRQTVTWGCVRLCDMAALV